MKEIKKIENFVQKGIRDQQHKWELEQQMKAQSNHQVRVLKVKFFHMIMINRTEISFYQSYNSKSI